MDGQPTDQVNEVRPEVWYAPLTRVTTLSKYLALVLFVILPILGFWLGVEHEKKYTKEHFDGRTSGVDNSDAAGAVEPIQDELTNSVVQLREVSSLSPTTVPGVGYATPSAHTNITDWQTFTDDYYSGITFKYPQNVQVSRSDTMLTFSIQDVVSDHHATLEVQALIHPVYVEYSSIVPSDWLVYEPLGNTFYRIPGLETPYKSYALHAVPTTVESDFVTDLQIRNTAAPVYTTTDGDAGWVSVTYTVIQRDELLPTVATFSTSYHVDDQGVEQWLETLKTLVRTFGRGVEDSPCMITSSSSCRG